MATKKFKCTVCGYIHEGKAAPENVPGCAAPASAFVEIEDAKKKGMLSDKNGNAYIIMYSTVMVVIVATLLAVAALSLQKRQYANELNEKKSSILSSLSAQDQDYDTFIERLRRRRPRRRRSRDRTYSNYLRTCRALSTTANSPCSRPRTAVW